MRQSEDYEKDISKYLFYIIIYMPKYNCCFPKKMKSTITERCSTFSFEQLDEFIKIDKNCGIIHTEIDRKSNVLKEDPIITTKCNLDNDNQKNDMTQDTLHNELNENNIIYQGKHITIYQPEQNQPIEFKLNQSTETQPNENQYTEQIWDIVNQNPILEKINTIVEPSTENQFFNTNEKILVSILESLKIITEQLYIIINNKFDI